MTALRRLMPASLAGRFALASAGMAAVVVLLIFAGSWWIIERQQALAAERLVQRERQFHAANAASNLRAIATRMTEVSNSTIIATGLVDSAGKETYLAPFLNGIRQINGIPIQLLFTDFAGNEIASNGAARFSPAQLEWLRRQLASGESAAEIFSQGDQHELVAMEPLRYSRTPTPEGAVLYKVSLADIRLEPGVRLRWRNEGPDEARLATPIAAPDVFQHLRLRVVSDAAGARTSQGPDAPESAYMLILALLIFAGVFLAGRRLARVLTRDLSELQAFSSQVVSAGSSAQRAPAGRSTEVASLAISINRMLDRLYQQHEALKLEGEKLAQLAEALKVADKRKDDFLAMLAHELRNPLAPIRTGAELLRTVARNDERVGRTSEIIARQVKHMTKIVDDLLDVSRVTRGLVSVERAPVDLHAVASAAVDQIRPLLETRGHQLQVDLTPERTMVLGDHARLVQVVSNLLHNAAKFTGDGGAIRLELRAEGGQAALRVSDNGAGIAPDFIHEIFGLFTQGTHTPDRSQGGLGLGLALVKHLIDLHGGTVVAESAGLGQGATFTVRLPLLETAAAAGGRPKQASSSAQDRLRIMVVDDNADAGDTLAALLQSAGHDVQVAYDGPQALDLAPRHPPQVFILDIGLPGMDGTELAQRLRATPVGRGAVLIALTGYGQDADREKSARAGFDHHLVKPVDPDVLFSLLDRVAAAGSAASANPVTLLAK